MSRIQNIANNRPSLLTSSQIQALVGQEHVPCPSCGGIDWTVTHKGEWICVECDPARALSTKGIAIRLLLVERDGRWVAADHRCETQRQRDSKLIQEAGGQVFAFNGDNWATWTTADGEVCYANLVFHDPRAIADLVAKCRTVFEVAAATACR